MPEGLPVLRTSRDFGPMAQQVARRAVLKTARRAAAVGAAALLLAGCGDRTQPTSREALEASTYLTQATESGLITLQAGGARTEADGVEFELLTTAEGDLDFDGEPDAAAIVVESNGSARLLQLHALLRDGDTIRDVSARLIGDRIGVQRLAIEAGIIQVDLIIRRPGEPAAIEPSVVVPAFFALTTRGLTPLVQTEVARGGAGENADPGALSEDLTLFSHEWRLSTFEMGDWSADLESLDQPPSLRFLAELADVSGASGQLTGFAGCNRLFGSFRAEEMATLRIAGLAATRRTCPKGPMDLENRFLNAFSSAERFEIDGGHLIVTGAGAVLRFEAGGRLARVDVEVRSPESDPEGTPVTGGAARRRT